MAFSRKARVAGAVGTLAGQAIAFQARRAAQRLHPSSLKNASRVVVFDWDESLSRTNTSRELLRHFLGHEAGEQRYHDYRDAVKQGHMTLEQAMIAGSAELVAHGVTTNDYPRLLDHLEQQDKIRTKLVELARYLKRRGRVVGIATKSAQGLADAAAARYGFDFGVGTEEAVAEDGRIIGVKRLVGDRRGSINGVPVVTKMDRVLEALRARNITASRRNIALVSDGYDDVKMFRDSGFGVLLRPSRPGTTQKLSQKLGLSDAQVGVDDITRLKLLLRFPKAILAPKARLDNAVDRLNAAAGRKRGAQ